MSEIPASIGGGNSAARAQAPHTKATREDWVRAALATLVADGEEQVRVLPLAQTLGVSRSSFYWYFKNREELLDELVRIWRDTNTRAILEKARAPAESIVRGVLAIFECWVDERLFDPRLDFAVREWARRSGRVRRAVHASDEARVEAIKELFRRHGYEATDAFIRARVLYFMQIGYYALEVKEAMETRFSYAAHYLRAFTGVEPDPGDLERFHRLLLARQKSKGRKGAPAARTRTKG